jgi:hypothetical protein
VLAHEDSQSITARPFGKWLWGLAVIPPLVAVITIVLAPDPHGHWNEHLWGAYLGGAQLVLLVVLAAVRGARTRRTARRPTSVLLLLALGVIAVGIVLEIVGNHQVAQSIWRTSGNPGFGDGYVEGHDRAETGDLLVVVGGVVFAFTIGLARKVPLAIAGVALMMVAIPPPWVWPAAGVLMLLLYGLTVDADRNRSPIRPAAQEPGTTALTDRRRR